MVSEFVNTHPGVVAYNVLQVLTISQIFKNEIASPMPYSKFGATKKSSDEKPAAKIPSKVAMLIIYVPATIVAFIFQIVLPLLAPASYSPSAAGWMVFAHFLKRDLEVLYVHKYSSESEANAAKMIGVSYALTAFMICLLTTPDNSSLGGTILFVVGSLGNLYHHHLLAQLRTTAKPGAKKEYKAPRGGIFEYVATPHYFFELVAWLGISIVSQQLTSHLNMVSMTCYLCARAYNQNQWNKNKFSETDWPASRRNLIPFLY